jgi:preprotein translocase subunit SecG
MEIVILVVHALLALGIIGLILLQQGKGADAGASFGGGASQTVFGSSGSGNFMSRSTAMLATAFFVTSFALAVIAKDKAQGTTDAGVPAELVESSDAEIVESELPFIAEEAVNDAAATDAPVIDAPVVEETK